MKKDKAKNDNITYIIFFFSIKFDRKGGSFNGLSRQV